MNEIASNKALINTKKINKKIKLIFKKKLIIFYLKLKSYLSNECDEEIKQHMQEINDMLETMTNNNVKSKNFKKTLMKNARHHVEVCAQKIIVDNVNHLRKVIFILCKSMKNVL